MYSIGKFADMSISSDLDDQPIQSDSSLELDIDINPNERGV